MNIIQNFLTIPLNVDPANSRISLVHDVLKNKKITAVYLLGSDNRFQIFDPYQTNALDIINVAGSEDLYLNLFDLYENHFVKDFAFNKDLDTVSILETLAKHNVGRVIDIYRSYLSYSITTANTVRKLLLLVAYQNGNLEPFDDNISGSLTIEIKPSSTYQNFLLKDFVRENLDGKLIKRIIVKTDNDLCPALGYLDLYTKNGKRIENFPSFILSVFGQKEVYFDPLNIDFNKSYYKQRGNYSLAGTDYNPKITFIY